MLYEVITEKVLVIEEGEPFMEEAIKAFAQEAGLVIPIQGKTEGLFTPLGEFHPAMIREKIAAFFGIDFTPAPKIDTSDVPEIANRPPNLCSGCSHRATFYAIKKAA